MGNHEIINPYGVFNGQKEFFRKYLNIPFIRDIVKYFVNLFVDILAYAKGMKFPKKFTWDWKLELLTNKFESETVSLFRKIIKPGMTVMDLGGHIGYYTRLFSKLVGEKGKVYVFEPSEGSFELLQYNASKCRNVKLFKKAVCDKDGTVSFNQTLNHSGANSILKTEQAAKTVTVPCTTIDTFVKENNINNIDVIKMDIEGAEPLVMKGAEQTIKKAKNLLIIMEFIEAFIEKGGSTPQKYLQYLKDLGFTIYTILPSGDIELFDTKNYDWEEVSEGKFVINLFLKK